MATVPPLDPPADADLLARFVRQRDEAAFAELVRRYGPVVRAACRRSLGETPDADDAFQAVFLILARKAGTLRNADLLGPWLHTVAVRAADRVRLIARRRLARERPVTAMPEPAIEPPEPRDWLPLLDAEIQRLPERWRLPLELCELEGLSRSEAAHRLGISEGTLSSRLARGRERLRQRLRRCGTVVAGAGLTAAFRYGFEAVPSPLLDTTTKAALTGATSAPVAALTQGVLKAMLFTKLKIASIVVLTLVLGGGVLVAGRYSAVRADDKAPDAKAEQEKLQGSWEVVSAKMNGKEAEGAEGDEIKSHKVVFAGYKVKAKHEGEYTLDPSKSPRHFDLKIDDGPEQERGTWRGIYLLNGDELTLCIALPSGDRPTDFVSKDGEAVMLLKLKRAK